MKRVMIVFSLLTMASGGAVAQDATLATLRDETPIDRQAEAPVMPKIENRDLKRQRAYPMQAPTIPHKIDNYQVDLYSHKCMSCHSRHRVEESQAPMVSVTHFMDRDGNFLAEVSPRRYFCNQCHVPQHVIDAEVDNLFLDVDTLIKQTQSNE